MHWAKAEGSGGSEERVITSTGFEVVDLVLVALPRLTPGLRSSCEEGTGAVERRGAGLDGPGVGGHRQPRERWVDRGVDRAADGLCKRRLGSQHLQAVEYHIDPG